jgi:cell division protein FtsW (lipid II flippase)
VTLVGMFSVYIAGNARGYDPSLVILLRNAVMMSLFFGVYFVLKDKYRGDFTILVTVAMLAGIGFVVQYRISSAINVDFQEALVKQYSAASIQNAYDDSTGAATAVAGDSLATTQSERSIGAIQAEARQLLKVEEFNLKSVLGDFVNAIPGWSRVLGSYVIALALLVYIIRKFGDHKFMASLDRPFSWITITVVLLFIFVALSEVGARGRFVYQMTPWEAFKITLIMFLAGFFSHYKDDFLNRNPVQKGKRLQRLIIPWGPFLLIWLIPQLLFVLLKDFGQVIIYGGLVLVMVFALTRRWSFLLTGLAFILLTSRGVLFLEDIAPAHVMQRFKIWSDIWALPHDETWWDNVYQIMNSFFAMNAGGLTGAGLGLGYPTNIPLVVSDFVYSALAEELGFLGAIVILMLYLQLFLSGMKIAAEAETEFEKLMAIGFSSMIAIQVFVNVGGVIKLIPMTGITLPFISRGGFSFLISMLMIAFLMGLSHRIALRRFD